MSIRRKPLTRAELDAAVKAHTDWAWNTSKRGQRSAERAEAAREQSQQEEQDQLESDTVKELREEVAGLKVALLMAIERLERVEGHRGI